MNAAIAEAMPAEQPPPPEWAEEDRARADHYALLAQLFYAPPDALLLASLATTGKGLARGEGAFAAAWAALAASAAAGDADAARDEYERLFIAIGKPEVTLYGSFYQAGFLNEEPLADLRDDLARLGLGRRAGIGESEDHIAALAEVMRHLIVTGPDDAGLARQREFFVRHLQPWYGTLCDALQATNADFYARVGGLTRAFLDIESAAFSFD